MWQSFWYRAGAVLRMISHLANKIGHGGVLSETSVQRERSHEHYKKKKNCFFYKNMLQQYLTEFFWHQALRRPNVDYTR